MKIWAEIKMPKLDLLDNEKLIASITEEEMKTATEKFASSKPPVVMSTNWNRIKLLRKNQKICYSGFMRTVYLGDDESPNAKAFVLIICQKYQRWCCLLN